VKADVKHTEGEESSMQQQFATIYFCFSRHALGLVLHCAVAIDISHCEDVAHEQQLTT
jgi:hypothetical protein